MKAFIGSILTIVGIGFISLESNLTLNIGDLLTLVCAVFFAAHIISIEYFAKDMNIYKLAFIQIFIAAIWFVGIAFITEPIPESLSSRAWLAILYLAIFSTFACFTIQTIAQKYTSSSHASIIMSLESVFAAVFGILLLGEKMNSMILIGCGLIFIAILIVEVDFSALKSLETPSPDKYNID